ncbi:hypothetical protein CAS74_001012 [Pichia kudriavzevii]|nr:hypothetical protein JL09_g650 [Pichia kudriavzevii]OUT24623.1 hypothetical protein CAS74_001012 [Pichia kudriavzevii]
MSQLCHSSITASRINLMDLGNHYSYPLTPSGSVESINVSTRKTIKQAIFEKITTITKAGPQLEPSPFYVCDLGELKRQLGLWNQVLPFVKPYYAVKCNPNAKFVETLIKFGNVGFDCASLDEIRTVCHIYESLGYSTADFKDNVIYANPVKPVSHLLYANNKNINLTTVDSIEEVEKIAKFTNGRMNVLIRITTDDSTATCPLSVKFGADLRYSCQIVQRCLDLGIRIRGIAFHCGSGFKDPSTLIKAVSDSRKLWDHINTRQYEDCDVLDVGGGFSKDSFLEPAVVLRNELLEKFGNRINDGSIKVISELGRFLTASVYTLTTNVIGVRNELDSNKVRVYLNDGLYGNLNCILYDHQEVEPVVTTSAGNFVYHDAEEREPNKRQYSLWGPTCDGLDCVVKKTQLSHHVQCGDWISFENCGAYTNAAATTFNGFTNEFECIYVDSEI